MNTHVADRRPLGALGRMGLVAALHLGLLFAITRSMGIEINVEAAPLIGEIFEEEAPPEDLPPPVDPDLTQHRDTVVIADQPPPPLDFEQESRITEQPPEIIERQEQTGGSAVVQPIIVGVQLDSRHPLSQPPYPPSMIRAGNTGTADIEIYVLPSGRVGDARIVRSTGYEALDQSALDEAKRKWRLTPATRDGVPFAQWHRLRVTFKLNQQR